MTDEREATWSPPGPGSWICDRSHTSPGPTPFYRRIVSEHTEPAYRKVMEDLGGPVGSIDMQFVNGAMYRRIVPLIAPDRDNGSVPPNAVLWLVTRLLPIFRKREKTAQKVIAERSYLKDVRHWIETERFEWIAKNEALEAIDPGPLDDTQLAAHLGVLDDALVEGWYRHHGLHGSDLGPIGDLLVHAQSWGLDPTEVMALLMGSSPATTDAAVHGSAIAAALRAGGVDPTTISSVDQIRSVPAASEALDAYLAEFGWRLVSDYDIEGLTLHELPGAVVAIVLAAAKSGPTDGNANSTSGTSQVGAGDASPSEREAKLRNAAGDPELFDDLLATAREAYGVRDDNGPITWAWPAGLLRRAYLEAAARLHGREAIVEPAHVFELDVPELRSLLTGATQPTARVLAERASHRHWESTLHAPNLLGPPPAEPDISPMPPAIKRLMGIVLAANTLLEPEDWLDRPSPAEVVGIGADGLAGLGIGTTRYRGRAIVATDPAKAIEEMQPGDVLVAAWTAPSFNAVLSIAGAVVVQEGGLLCHAAVMARELRIPAVVGCGGAMTAITSGDIVEVDAVGGTVTLVDSPDSELATSG